VALLYDATGNLTRTLASGVVYTQTWDRANRLAMVTSGSVTVTFGYDAAGALAVKTVRQGSAVTTTHYIGGYYERTINGAARRYYRLGDQWVLREGTGPYQYLYGDHLNSATLTTDAAGTKTSETRYFPYGAHRFDWGSDPSDRDFTGQRRDAEIALLDYVARRYSPYLGRFISPDSIIPDPGNPQGLNRYAYVRNNPLRYMDPTGHRECGSEEDCQANDPPQPRNTLYRNIIRKMYKDAYEHYLPKKLIDNYVDESGPLRLTAQEAIDTNPFLRIQDSKDFPKALTALKQKGGGSTYLKTRGPGVSLTNGTLGNFTANYEGDLTISSDGRWLFDGQVDFYDYWDFDSKPEGSGRSRVGELKVRITAAILPGKPFDITSDPLRVSQTSSDWTLNKLPSDMSLLV